MCGDETPKEASGGVCAVLQPVPSRFGPGKLADARLLIHPELPPLPMMAKIEMKKDDLERDTMRWFWVRVHADGDLRKPVEQSPILFKFFLSGESFCVVKGSRFDQHGRSWPKEVMAAKKNPSLLYTLDVGEFGLIGRRVSVWMGPTLAARGGPPLSAGGGPPIAVAQGIIGRDWTRQMVVR